MCYQINRNRTHIYLWICLAVLHMFFDVNRKQTEKTSIILRDTASKVMFACVSCFLPFPTILSIHMCASRYWTILGTDQCGKVTRWARSDLHRLHITLSLWCVNVNAVDLPYIRIYIYIIDYYSICNIWLQMPLKKHKLGNLGMYLF